MTFFPRLSLALAFIALTSSAGGATWYVNAEGRSGDGTSAAAPFRTLAQAQAASAPGDTIVVAPAAAPYAERIELKEGQTLAGAPGQASPALRVAAGAAVSVRDAGNVTVRDLAIQIAEEGEGIVIANAHGNVLLQRAGIAGSGGGTALRIEGGDAAVIVDASPIAQKNGAAVIIRNHKTSAVVFRNGSTIAVSAGTKDAIALTANTGTYTFGDALTITTSGARALAVESSGTVAISDAKSALSTAGATGVRIAGTKVAIALGKIDVDAKGADNGIALDRVTGQFALNGGAIQHVAKSGVALSKSENIDLRGLTITASAKYGLSGDGVRNLTLSNVEIRGAGDELEEHGVHLHNISGELRMGNCRILRSASRQLNIDNDTGELSIDVRSCTFAQSLPPNGGQGMLIRAGGDARVRAVIESDTFTDNFSNAVHIIAADNADVRADVLRGTFRKNAAAVVASAGGSARMNVRVEGSQISGSTSTALNIHSTSAGDVRADLVGNTIGVAGSAGSGASCGGGCGGIAVNSLGRGATKAGITGNTVQEVDAFGIQVRGGGIASLAVRITGNAVREPAGASAGYAISVAAGMKRTDSVAVCAEIGGAGALANTISGNWNPGGGGPISLRRAFENTSLALAGYTGAAGSADAAASFLAGRNRGARAEAALGAGLQKADRCSIP